MQPVINPLASTFIFEHAAIAQLRQMPRNFWLHLVNRVCQLAYTEFVVLTDQCETAQARGIGESFTEFNWRHGRGWPFIYEIPYVSAALYIWIPVCVKRSVKTVLEIIFDDHRAVTIDAINSGADDDPHSKYSMRDAQDAERKLFLQR